MADEKVRKWLSDREKFQQGSKNKYRGNQNKESPKVKKESNMTQEKTECDDPSANVEKRGGKRRIAANFGNK